MLKIIFRDIAISVEIEDFTMSNAKHKAVADILTKANFSHAAPGLWRQTNDLEKWYKQCEALVSKVGGNIIDNRGQGTEEKIGEFSYFASDTPTPEQRIAILEAEVKRLGEIGAIAQQELQQLEQQLKQLS